MKELVSYTEALGRVLDARLNCNVEKILLAQAVGRTAGQDIVSNDNIPPFDNSAMDGYAVVSSDASQAPVTLRVVEEIPAGAVPRESVQPGTCSRIMTGAVIPEGADTVVPVEQTLSDGELVTIRTVAPKGQHIRRSGADIARGDVVVGRGTRITPSTVGILAAIGAHRVPVVRMPVVAVVATGDELVEPGEELSPGKIRNSNGVTLAAQAAAAGAVVLGPFVARDSRESVQEILDDIEAADIIVFAGGVSVGEFDFVQEALEKRGMETIFWRVRQRPGKPLLFGDLKGVPVFGLPGNPVSASVCFEMYVRPLIEASVGMEPARLSEARLGETVKKKVDLHYFARGVLKSDSGDLVVNMAGPQASNIFSTMVRANCIVHLPEDRETIEKGELVQISPLTWRSI
ncbi:MAG: molybdopterin molybdotransferase MoeA [Rhodothermales bacterium]|nr:molybdopterin molybdotransferase MoeA [Rhodothermales bacterium]